MAAGGDVLLNAMGISKVILLGLMIIYPAVWFPFDLWHQFSIGGMLFFLLEWNSETVQGFSKPMRWTVIANCLGVLVMTMAFTVLRVTGGEDVGHPDSRVRSIVCLVFAAMLIALRKAD